MKTRKLIAVIGSVALAASMGITGCSMVRADERDKDETEVTEKETEKEEEEDECDPCGCCLSDEDMEYYSGCCYDYEFVSTNGELEGQLDYMTLAPGYDEVNWDRYPDDDSLQDINDIEDEELRELAQGYIDDGYIINDPKIEQQYGMGILGDGEYQFCNGFSGYDCGDDVYRSISVYRMNETLFEYFCVDMLCIEHPERTDDCTIIRVGNDEEYVEFNRDTGIGTYYFSFDNSEAVG